jgi:hypothetical protein
MRTGTSARASEWGACATAGDLARLLMRKAPRWRRRPVAFFRTVPKEDDSPARRWRYTRLPLPSGRSVPVRIPHGCEVRGGSLSRLPTRRAQTQTAQDPRGKRRVLCLTQRPDSPGRRLGWKRRGKFQIHLHTSHPHVRGQGKPCPSVREFAGAAERWGGNGATDTPASILTLTGRACRWRRSRDGARWHK